MSLKVVPDHPQSRCYVLKLHRDAAPAEGRLFGRLEHLVSGDWTEFDSAETLLAWLAGHCAAVNPPSVRDGPPRHAAAERR